LTLLWARMMSAGYRLRRLTAVVAIAIAGFGSPAFALDQIASRTIVVGDMTAGAPPSAGARSAVATAAKPPAARSQLAVTVDRAKVIRLPEATRTVIVGNPAIADVAIQKAGIVVITGKSYGETNLIALDTGGNMLAETALVVEATRDAIVTVQRGLERQSYSCTPSCMPAVQLGDAATYYGNTKEQAQQHSQFSGQR
jgi:Flp pilus assembly secretin CpaC